MEQIDRSKGLGASEAAAVVGMNPWCGPDKLWKQKTGRVATDRETPAMRCGTILEPYIREITVGILKEQYRRDVTLVEVQPWEQDPQHPWRRRSLDGVCPELNANVQVKTSSARDKWGPNWSDEITEYVLPQVVHEMSWPWGDIEFERSFIPVAFIPEPAWAWRKMVCELEGQHEELLELVDQLDIGIFQVWRDEKKEPILLEQEERFWGYVERDEKPPEDFVDESAKEALAR